MLKFVVTWTIRSDWTQDVVCEAGNAAHAVAISKEKLAVDHGLIAARWGEVASITRLQG